ncbi:TSUP family transporter [Jannaschia donghaensis]|uniref:Probable membrane transporter protein n=1 Tax=Jannaschia donghaensis TaxID=420998 RepID=A0A0M6YJQ1_9RHOB|nr:TSUP family transporter [Jannaschia donghaensis]CTQ49733.1 Sulfite exporter TauE/SafE [Jannaschia donghaensis]
MADLDLLPADLALLAAIAFAAGLVRGFSGFALSALVMASAVLIVPPAQLIPICWVLEMTASLLMVRGGVADADRRIAFGLAFTSALGVPLGLYLTTTLPVDATRVLALTVLVTLAVLQLARIRLAVLATDGGLYATGLIAGIVTGIASIGGMVVALYVLAQDRPARVMRGSLVLFLFVSSVFSLMWLLGYGVMTGQAFARGAILAGPCAAGVILGKRMFNPTLEPYYKPFALCLLIGLASLSLLRTIV